jgi:lipopolysaccharide transport system ATP-binding protein
MSEYAFIVENIGKQYRIGAEINRSPTLRDKLVDIGNWPKRALKGEWRRKYETFWALKDISFEVKKGQVLGIIGRNGAGKSTLLKVLTRVTEPTTGQAIVNGRVGSLLEVGTGFHPELTGRENIYLNGAVLGMKRSDIESKFDEIVEFSGVSKFIDTPVKRFSSGMYLRLAFSVAAHLEPDILIVDEVLAVGDAEFQRKCLGKMDEVSKAGRTVLFVSHDMSAIMRLTDEAIVLDKGKIIHRAPTQEAIDFYMSSRLSQAGERTWTEDEIPAVSEPFKPIAIRVKDKENRVVNVARSAEPLTVEVEYEIEQDIKGLRVGIYLQTSQGAYIFAAFDTDMPAQYEKFGVRKKGHYFSKCTIPAHFLNERKYILGMNASSYRVKSYFQDEHALSFGVDIAGAPGKQWAERRIGVIRPDLGWKIEKK